MAEAAVESLLENLNQLMFHHLNLIIDVNSLLKKLESDLRFLRAFLKDTTKRRRNDDSLQQLVHQIRDIVYEVEDVVDIFVAEAAAKSNSKIRFFRPSKILTSATLRRVAVDVEQVIAKVREIYDDTRLLEFGSYSARDESYKEMPHVREDNVVGFDEDERILIKYLEEETEQLDVITIVGMSGLGKTTLARKIFRNPEIADEFPFRIWVHVSEEFKMKDVLFSILKHFTHHSDHLYDKSEPELAQLVVSYLEREKFLIVMDGVWTIDDWYKLQLALPKDNRKGKVLVTSCKEDVARIANHTRDPYRLSFLSHEESWMLLQLEVFGKLDVCPDELKPLGMLIAEQCGGLPVAIVAMADVIAKEYSKPTNMRAKMDAWRQACKNVHIHLNSRLYNELPTHLRPCFLYFGMFPEDYEISAWRLIRMWIAEGFVQAKEGQSSEEIAEYYLEDLINRSLLMVGKRKADGRIKTCRIHETLHSFCKSEAGKERENILQEIRQSSDASFEPPLSQELTNRRLCIHSNVLDFLSSRPHGRRVRSFVSFSRDEVNLPPEYSAGAAIPSGFRLLRVLDVQPIKFTKIPMDMFQLVHLRYMVLSINRNVLPLALARLWNLQTLVLHTTHTTLDVRVDIWQLSQLRHFKTNASALLPRISKSSKEGEQLQTLGTILPECCTKEFIERARSLKNLGIRGEISFLQRYSDFFDCFRRLSHLQKLKLVNVMLNDGHIFRGMYLPPPYKFPPRLRSLTLADTRIDWKEMSILGMLGNLEVLKLKDKAFMGSEWEVADGGFRSLEVLHIECTDLVVWKASAHHFPRLKHLNLRNCEQLQEVPIGLADIRSLQQLDLYRTNLAASSAKKILEAKQEVVRDQGIEFGGFKLSIFPPSE